MFTSMRTIKIEPIKVNSTLEVVAISVITSLSGPRIVLHGNTRGQRTTHLSQRPIASYVYAEAPKWVLELL